MTFTPIPCSFKSVSPKLIGTGFRKRTKVVFTWAGSRLFYLPPYTQGEKNNWKELGLNPGPLDLQATTLTTTIGLGSFLGFKANIGRTHKCSRLRILERKFLRKFPSCWCTRTWSKKKKLFQGLRLLESYFLWLS